MYKLYAHAQVFAKAAKKELNLYLTRYKRVFYFLSIIVALGTATATTITTLVLSKVVWVDYPDWYFFVTAGISALGALMSSILNYFLVKDKIVLYKRKIKCIEAEELKYLNRSTPLYQDEYRDFNFYLAIASQLDSNAAKKEVQHD